MAVADKKNPTSIDNQVYLIHEPIREHHWYSQVEEALNNECSKILVYLYNNSRTLAYCWYDFNGKAFGGGHDGYAGRNDYQYIWTFDLSEDVYEQIDEFEKALKKGYK